MTTTYRGTVASFRTAGLASTNHNILTLFNALSSTKLVAVRQLILVTDETAVLTAVAPLVQVSRITTAPTGGTVLAKVPFDTALTPDPSFEVRGATASDGGVATAITSTAGARLWAALKHRLHTAVGQVLFDHVDLIPELCKADPIILRAQQGLNVQVAQAAQTTSHYLVAVAFEEYVV